jgi:hypothetical protein
MDPIKAHKLGVKPEEIRVTTEGGRYGGAWILWVADEMRDKLIITQSHNIFELIRWRLNHRVLSDGS